jgi:hypothetical protein
MSPVPVTDGTSPARLFDLVVAGFWPHVGRAAVWSSMT